MKYVVESWSRGRWRWEGLGSGRSERNCIGLEENINEWDGSLRSGLGRLGRNDSASTTFVSNVPHDDAAPSPASLASLVVPSLPSLAPLHVDNSLATAPPPNNSYPTHQFIEDFRIPFNSPDTATADPDFKKQKEVIATQAPQPAPETSAISYPPSASVPLVDVLLQPNTIPLTPPATQTFPSPASSAPALDNILHTGPSLFFLFSYYNFN